MSVFTIMPHIKKRSYFTISNVHVSILPFVYPSESAPIQDKYLKFMMKIPLTKEHLLYGCFDRLFQVRALIFMDVFVLVFLWDEIL